MVRTPDEVELVVSPSNNHHHAEHHMEHRSSDKEAPQDPLLEDEEEDEDEQDPGEDREIGKDHGHPPSARLQSDGPSRRSHPDDEDSIMVKNVLLHLAVKWWAKHWKAAMVAYLALHLLVAAALDWTRAKAPVLFGMACAAIYAAAVVRRRVISHSAYTSLRVSDQWRVRGRQGCCAALTAIFGVGISINILGGFHRLLPLLGLCVAILIAWGISRDRRNINWTTVAVGVFMQYGFAVVVIQTKVGFTVFSALGSSATQFMSYADVGGDFVFTSDLASKVVVALRVLPTIVFFSSFSGVLEHIGALQALVAVFGSVMEYTMQCGATESLCAAANVFLGQSESPLLIAPFLPGASMSELHAIMTAGFSTIAGGVMAAYLAMGVPASHLLGASVISAPAALAISKVVMPKGSRWSSADTHGGRDDHDGPTASAGDEREGGNPAVAGCCNVFEAATQGASRGLVLAANVGGMLIAFISLKTLLDDALSWWCGLVGHPEINFTSSLSVFFFPFSVLMGTPIEDCWAMGRLLGIKTAANEFVAYSELMELQKSGALHERSVALATYALCGFSNVSSIGVVIAGLSVLAPKRQGDLSRMVVSACICGNLACFTTACVAGLLL